MKEMFLLPFIVFFSFLLASPTLASETDLQLEDLSELGEITYQDDEITVRNFGNDPVIADIIANSVTSEQQGVVGPGGKSSITAGNTGRILYWSVTPNTLWPYSFDGYVKLRYYSGFKRDAPIGGWGAIGSSVSGTVTMNKNNGGYATLTGTAYSMDYVKRTVLPGVGTSY